MTSSRQDLKGSKSKEIIAIAQGPKFKPQYCAKRERERERRKNCHPILRGNTFLM
jgi:hypothetical protein